MQFNVEEENLICLYHNADRRRTMAKLHAALPDMDGEMAALARQTLAKLETMTDADFAAHHFHFTDAEVKHNEAPGAGAVWLLRPALFFLRLCLLYWEIRQVFQQFHNQVLLHILVPGQLVDHGGIVFNHLFRGPFLTRDGGFDRGAVQQHFLFGHPLNTPVIVFIQHTTEAPGIPPSEEFSYAF